MTVIDITEQLDFKNDVDKIIKERDRMLEMYGLMSISLLFSPTAEQPHPIREFAKLVEEKANIWTRHKLYQEIEKISPLDTIIQAKLIELRGEDEL